MQYFPFFFFFSFLLVLCVQSPAEVFYLEYMQGGLAIIQPPTSCFHFMDTMLENIRLEGKFTYT